MRGKLPIVQQYMTRIPMEVEQCQTVDEAIQLMRAHGIRHIPVMNGSHLKGIVSDRDLLQIRLNDKHSGKHLLNDICQQDVLSVSPIALVDAVARLMLKRKVGSAVVVDGGFVVGIFTTTDALRVLSDLGGPS